LPAKYAIESYPLAIGSCVDFQGTKEKKPTMKDKKRKIASDDEDVRDAEEKWDRQKPKSDIVKKVNKKKAIGHFQAGVHLESQALSKPSTHKMIYQFGFIFY
jgi:hypothetical protein